MSETRSVVLQREVEAVRIPSGETVMLPAGSEVYLTQTLGGSFTVRAEDGLYRISGAGADALGLVAEEEASTDGTGLGCAPGTVEDLERRAWETLKTCYDPEIPVNIVDLGLVYDLHLEALEGGKHRACVKMTLTAPGCGMGQVIAADAQERLLGVAGIDDAEVEIVWDPLWHHSMMTAEGRRILGLE
jgi:probable FeS assembly SUF system protein SufT